MNSLEQGTVDEWTSEAEVIDSRSNGLERVSFLRVPCLGVIAIA